MTGKINAPTAAPVLGRTGRLAALIAAAALLPAVTVAVGGGPAWAAHSSGGRGVHSGPAVAWRISTVAGSVGGPAKATAVAMQSSCGVSFANGYLYIADGGSVRKVGLGAGWLTTPAGNGTIQPYANGIPAAKASLHAACQAAVDQSGNLLIAEQGSERIRVAAAVTGTFYGQAMTAGHIYTVAGNGGDGYSGDGGPATSAALAGPHGMAVDSAGNLVIADTGNNRIRVVASSTGTFYGQAMTAGHIYTVAGNGTPGYSGDGIPATGAELARPQSVAVDSSGSLVISAPYRIRVVAGSTGVSYGQAMTAGDIYTVAGNGTPGYSGNGGPATSARLKTPFATVVDSAGNLVVADTGNNRIRVVASSTGTFYGQAMTAGHIYTVAGNGTAGDSGDGGRAVRAALNQPQGVTADSAGNLVIADAGSPSLGGGHWVRVVAAADGTFYGKAMATGRIYTVAGNGTEGYSGDNGPVSRAQLDYPESVAADGSGNLVIADALNNRIRVAAAVTGTFYGQSMTAGHIYTVAGDAGYGYDGDGGPATSASFAIPFGVSIDHSGNLVIADNGDCRIRVVAGSTGTFYGQAMTAGHIYTVAGNGTPGYSGDGGPATSAALTRPYAVIVDTAGNLVIGDTDNQRIRVAAAVTGTFYGLAMTAGDIYTVAGGGTGGRGDGGPATSAALNHPEGVAVDTAGNVFIADAYDNRVRMVADSTGTFYGQAMTAGDIYTVTGGGSSPNDGVPATAAALSRPTGVALDTSGNLLIADTQSYRIRVVPDSTGTFYGQAMTAGDVYTIAGQYGYAGYSGDGGRARSAQLSLPVAIAVNGAGNLLIADRGNDRIRMITR